MTPKTETIDLTPEMLKSAEGRKLVQDAQYKLDDAIATVAQVTAGAMDDLQFGSAVDRDEVLKSIGAAIIAWSKASSDFTFTLGGYNPETRKRYHFTLDAPAPTMDKRVELALSAWHGILMTVGAWPFGTAMRAALRAAFPEHVED